MVRYYQRMLLSFGLPALVLVITLLSMFTNEIGSNDGRWVAGPWAFMLASLLGLLGALTSAAQRSTRVRRERVLIQLGSHTASFSRIPIGLIAGMTVWLFSVATADASSINAANLLLAAFGAGFAERLVVQYGPPGRGDFAPPSVERK